MLSRWIIRTALIAVAVLVWTPPALPAASVDEDVKFGRGLLEKGFYPLGIEMLESVEPRLETDSQKVSTYAALAEARMAMSQRPPSDLSGEEAEKYRNEQLRAAAEYRRRVAELGPLAGLDTLEGLTSRVSDAQRAYEQIKRTQSDDIREQLIKLMNDSFLSAIKGLEGLTQKNQNDLEAWYEKAPDDYEGAEHRRWKAQEDKLQEARLLSGIQLAKTRYAYSKTLDPAEAEAKHQLLTKTAEDLTNLCYEYSDWGATIDGYLLLADLQANRRKFDATEEAALSALELLADYARANPSINLDPWRNRALASWAYASAKLGRFTPAIKRMKDIDAPEVRIKLAEVYLMQAAYLAKHEKTDQADGATAKAEAVLRQVAAAGDAWAREAEDVKTRYGMAGTGYAAARQKLDDAILRRDWPAVIAAATELLSFGDAVPTEKRQQFLAAMGAAYWQQKMYYEGYTVYEYLALCGADENAAETNAKYAVACIERQYRKTDNPADFALVEAARKWRRDNFETGAGQAYGQALEAKRDGRYEDAIRLFGQVPPDSLHFEPALEQRGECYLFFAAKLQKADPAKSAELLRKSKNDFLEFLRAARRPATVSRVLQQRKRFTPAAIYRLATVYLWRGSEDYKACLQLTTDFAERFPDATAWHPYVTEQRVRAHIGLNNLSGASAELAGLATQGAKLDDSDRSRQITERASEIVFAAYDGKAREFKKEAADKEAEAAKTADPAQAKKLRAEAGEKLGDAAAAVQGAVDAIIAGTADVNGLAYEKLLYVIYQYDWLGRRGDLIQYLGIFLDKFGDRKDLTPEQREDVAKAWIMLGITHFNAGQWEQANAVLQKRREVLDAEHAQLVKKIPSATRAPDYWTVLLYIGQSAKALAAESEDRAREATGIFEEIRKRMQRRSPDWWNLSADIIEVQNMRQWDDGTLIIASRTLATDTTLGGHAVRARYAAVLKDIYKRVETDEKRRREVVGYLAQIYLADLDEFANGNQYADMIRLVLDLGAMEPDFAGAENRKKLRPFVQTVATNATDPVIRGEAERLLEKMKD